ncbi:type I 3-dehydroquinate dehydratase [Cellulomonas endophytica]|uniref:type I 3-dehydroquinate dehydratase n=1 Tax=Cellulomonas endophytica TaxID=2494735 RepID=UPI001012AFEB|nr:type I 3-dehydroquinate dehydratase [Cellulomonas endophytica]
MDPRTLVLVGPPGAPVVEVARALARRLGVPVLDPAEELARRAGGRDPGLVLVEDGEDAFRALERAVVADALAQAHGGGVVAVPSGAVLDAGTRERLVGVGAAGGAVVHLELDAGRSAKLAGLDAAGAVALGATRARWRAMLAERRPLLEAVSTHVVAAGEAAGPGADEVLATAVARAVGLRAVRPVVLRGGLALGTGTPKVVVPLVAATPGALLAAAADVRAAAPDLVEWRLDALAGGPEPGVVATLGPQLVAALGGLPLLVTVRTDAEGGPRPVSGEAYVAAYAAGLGAGVADLVDVQLLTTGDAGAAVVAAARAAGVPVVGSSHDFAGTPAVDALVGTLLALERRGADVLKVAVMPRSPADVLTLLRATWEAGARTDRPLLTVSMAADGVVSRLAGGVFGSCATFGTVGAGSAPGQVPVADLRAALALVHGGLG